MCRTTVITTQLSNPAKLLLSASEMPNLEGQMPEEYTRGQVDDQPMSPIDETAGRLDKLLVNRPAEKELVGVRQRGYAKYG